MRRRLNKKIEFTDFADYNPHRYPCVRDFAVYTVKAGDLVGLFATEPSTSGRADTAGKEQMYYIEHGDGTPYFGTKEFDSLKAIVHHRLPPLRHGGTPSVILNGAVVPYTTTIDLNHAQWIRVMTGPYANAHAKFKNPDGIIYVAYWTRP